MYVHTAFAFFADPAMQSFYRRFVRDYMRYKDEIQCAGHTLVQAVRAEALSVAPHDKVIPVFNAQVRKGKASFFWLSVLCATPVDR